MSKMNTTRFERIKKQVKEGNISDEQCRELMSLLIVRVGASDIENTSSSIQPALSLIPNDIPHEWKLALTKQAHREGFSSGYYEAWQIGSIMDTTKQMVINMAMKNDDDQFELVFLGSELATRLAVIAGHINSVPEHFKLSRPTKDNSVILPYRPEDVGKITGLVGELTTQHDTLFRKTMNNIEIMQKEGILPQHEIKSLYDVTILVRDNVMSLVEESMRVASGLKSLISGQDDGTELRDACKQVSIDNEQVFAWRDSFKSPGAKTKTAIDKLCERIDHYYTQNKEGLAIWDALDKDYHAGKFSKQEEKQFKEYALGGGWTTLSRTWRRRKNGQ